jgi:predicted amidohydrolase
MQTDDLEVAGIPTESVMGGHRRQCEHGEHWLVEASAFGSALVVFAECGTAGYCFLSVDGARTPQALVRERLIPECK